MRTENVKPSFKQLLQIDKLLHNLINYIIVFTLSVLTSYYIGLATALVTSFLKEFLWDKKLKKGTYEVADLIASGLGMLEATIMYLIYLI